MKLTPDGARYLNMAQGRTVPAPFHYRWLLPKLCGTSARRWQASTWGGFGVTAVLVGVWAGGWAGVAAGLLFLSLPSVTFGATHPVLVDAPMLAFATAAALVPIPAAVACALAAACISEKGPPFAALFAWHPLPLVALVVPLARHRSRGTVDATDPLGWTLLNPREAGRRDWRNLGLVLPWGGCLAALGALTTQLAATLGVAYSQLAAATDQTRLYQLAAPLVCVTAATSVPTSLLAPLVAATWFNPWRGNGV